MKNKQTFGPVKVAPFVDCNVVGRTNFYNGSPVKNNTPKFSKGWKEEVKGSC